ncbi:MAG: hypothetical protein IPN73_14385 [Saprospiraceae bacterium]|nr:hypothetical protein [Saprospiraceae bacterium]
MRPKKDNPGAGKKRKPAVKSPFEKFFIKKNKEEETELPTQRRRRSAPDKDESRPERKPGKDDSRPGRSPRRDDARPLKEAPGGTIHAQKEAPGGMIHAQKEAPEGMIHAQKEAQEETIHAQKEAPGGMIHAQKEAQEETIHAQKEASGGMIHAQKEAQEETIHALKEAAEVERAEVESRHLVEKEKERTLVQSVNLSQEIEKKDQDQTENPDCLMRIFLTDQGILKEKKKRLLNLKKGLPMSKKQWIKMKLFV